MLKNIIELIRVKHWIKNGFVIIPYIFSKNLFNPEAALNIFVTVLSFSLIASTVYIINDYSDRNEDLHHPVKKHRPIASGKVSKRIIFSILPVLFSLSFIFAFMVNINLVTVIAVYFITNLVYTFFLKHEVILDVIMIAFYFIMRVTAGSVALNVDISNWILLTTFFIALFLGFAKRKNEILFSSDKGTHKKVLSSYDDQLLNSLIIICLTLTIISYSLYTKDPMTIKTFNSDKLIYTIPFVVYGLFRYLYLVFKHDQGGDPGEVIFSDKNMFINIVLWLVSVVCILYFS